MSEAVALAKHACPACGAEAHWNPVKGKLVCPYCGTESPATLTPAGAVIQEHDLVTALRAVPAGMRGWEKGRVSVQCRSCKAISLFQPERVAQRCEFCGSPAIVPYAETRAPIVPESVLPFRVSESQVRESMRTWYGSQWFAPNRLKRAALTDTLHGLYIPYWTFDAKAYARWTAEAGYYYYVNERVGGQTKRVRKVRWEPAAGEVRHVFDDELVPATMGIRAELLRQIEPFPTGDLIPYDPGYVSGWVVEQYQIDLVLAADHARQQMDEKVRELCAAEIPGDTHRNLVTFPEYTDRTFKHVLAPVWVLGYTYGPRTFQVLINGYTGAIAGEHPLSWVKIAFAVFVALLAVMALLYFNQ